MNLDELAVPIVLAPMAGGPSTPALCAAVSNAGGLGFLAAGYLTAAQLDEQLQETRRLTARPYGVNLFVPSSAPTPPAVYSAYVARLAGEGELARGIRSRFIDEHDAHAPLAYPEIHHVTAPLRKAGRERGDGDVINLWAGQAHQLAQDRPAAQVVAALAAGGRR